MSPASSGVSSSSLQKLRQIWGSNVSLKFSKPFDIRMLNRDSAWRRSIASDQAVLSARFAVNSTRRTMCPLCNGSDSSRVMVVHGVSYLECATCSHLYSELIPLEGAVQSLYGDSEGSDASSQAKIYLDDTLFARRIEMIGRPKVDFVTEVIGSTAGEWLDIGCGTGEVLVAARDAGWHVRGIEADIRFVDFAQMRGLPVEHGFVTGDNSSSLIREATVVSLFNLVEHLEDPVGLLKAIVAGARRGTWVVIEVPRHPSLSSLSNLLFPSLSARHIYPPDHLHVFTDASLRQVLGQAGISPFALWLFGQDIQDFVMTGVSHQLREQPLPRFVDQILDAAPQLQQCVDEAGLSDTIVVVGRTVGN